jgi:hypothetical protein
MTTYLRRIVLITALSVGLGVCLCATAEAQSGVKSSGEAIVVGVVATVTIVAIATC